jgi:hypothetical protein
MNWLKKEEEITAPLDVKKEGNDFIVTYQNGTVIKNPQTVIPPHLRQASDMGTVDTHESYDGSDDEVNNLAYLFVANDENKNEAMERQAKLISVIKGENK